MSLSITSLSILSGSATDKVKYPHQDSQIPHLTLLSLSTPALSSKSSCNISSIGTSDWDRASGLGFIIVTNWRLFQWRSFSLNRKITLLLSFWVDLKSSMYQLWYSFIRILIKSKSSLKMNVQHDILLQNYVQMQLQYYTGSNIHETADGDTAQYRLSTTA